MFLFMEICQYHAQAANNNNRKLGLAIWTFKWRLHEEAFCHALAVTSLHGNKLA